MRISIALVIGAALLAFALIANAPASLVDRELAAATVYRVRLADVHRKRRLDQRIEHQQLVF